MRRHPNALPKLVWAQNELRRVRDQVTPDVAPRVAKRIRSLLKSIDGAVRNAERFSHRVADLERYSNTVDNHCPECNQFESECTCHE